MNAKKLTRLSLAVLMSLSLAACSSGGSVESTPSPSPEPTTQTPPTGNSGDGGISEASPALNDGQDSSIVEIIEIIDNRWILEDRYLNELSSNTALVEMLREYNELTPILTEFFTTQATDVLVSVTEIYDPPVSSDILDEMIIQVASHSLYKDCTQRFLDDPLLYPFIEREAGGSAGMWPYTWHTFYLDAKPDMKTLLEEYFDLVENVVKQLENIQIDDL